MGDDTVTAILERMKKGEVVARDELVSLKGQNLTSLDLSGLNFSDADLSGTVFFGCNLQNANFFQTILTGADFTGANLANAQFAQAVLDSCSFGHAVMHRTNCFGTSLKNATLTGAEIKNADFRTADLSDARMREAVLEATDCTGTIMNSVDMSYSSVNECIFNDADMRNTILRHVKDYQSALWIGVDIRNINFSGAYSVRRFIVDQNYLHEFKNRGPLFELIYKIWWLTSDCGRSLVRWMMVIIVQILCFASIYCFLDFEFKVAKTWFSYIYFSIVTTTTLGYGDILPISPTAQFVAMIQVLLGYAMLGGFLSILTNKMARRAD